MYNKENNTRLKWIRGHGNGAISELNTTQVHFRRPIGSGDCFASPNFSYFRYIPLQKLFCTRRSVRACPLSCMILWTHRWICVQDFWYAQSRTPVDMRACAPAHTNTHTHTHTQRKEEEKTKKYAKNFLVTAGRYVSSSNHR